MAGLTRPYSKLELPIHKILPDVIAKIRVEKGLVLQAPTGAGKTTVVPLAALEAEAINGLIIVMQPRRIACVGVARRMAELWGERIGETIGYRMRHDAVVGNHTRLEVVTEGILLRMLRGSPQLEGVGAVFFDEFHERNIDSDASFALCLHVQQRHHPNLKLIVMSATFGVLGKRLASLLGDCPLIHSEGRCFPVEVRYRGCMAEHVSEQGVAQQRLEHSVAETVRDALEEFPQGDVLVFLPGEQEIMYTWIFLNNLGIGDGRAPKRLIGWARRLIDTSAVDLSRKVQVSPLYGTLEQEEQDEVLSSSPPGWRKVILATPIAESSLTVPGVRILVDSGLRRTRVATTGPAGSCTGSRMCTQPVSRASAEQRKGRAGRVAPGLCFRLWTQEEHAALLESDEPELHREDLAPILLDLMIAGHVSKSEILALPWVDTPREDPLRCARELLARLGALDAGSGEVLSERGHKLGALPLHPRLGHMVLQAQVISTALAAEACALAALLGEKELLQGGRLVHGANLEARDSPKSAPRVAAAAGPHRSSTRRWCTGFRGFSPLLLWSLSSLGLS
ncbi:unnamed protein product [Polarella glacialis]|uniref:ATP-dependent helicase HrpB n=1 Tax=Polarella glacialis TaxID=89957 RepID=A0A813LSF1_POLGL|nr:unnamed protein product [Polarella glacialis]